MLRGQLHDFPLTEVARLLSATSKTGSLVVRTREATSSLFFNLGQIQTALSGDHSGLDALEHMAAQITGEFEFVEGITTDQNSLSSFPTDKLLEILERINLSEREMFALRPAANDIPRYLSGHVPADFEASTDDLALALSARGVLSVEELAHQFSLDPSKVMETFARFRRAGFIEIIGQKSLPVTEPPAAPPEAAPSSIPLPPHSNEPAPIRYWRGRPIK